MSTQDIRKLLATRRERGGGHDVTQTLLEALLDRVEKLEAKS